MNAYWCERMVLGQAWSSLVEGDEQLDRPIRVEVCHAYAA